MFHLHDGVAGQHGQYAVKRVAVVSGYEVENVELVMVSATDQVCCLQIAILAKIAHKQSQRPSH